MGDHDDANSPVRLVQDLLLDSFGRIADGVPAVVDGLSVDELLWRADAEANHIAWLVWHLARQQDDQVAHVGGVPPAWHDDAWPDRFGLPYERNAHGYGMTTDEVGAFPLPDPSVLSAYYAAVHDLTTDVVKSLDAQAYSRVIDRSWDPPVTVSTRLVSVVDDAAKHLGQAEYLRGLILRRR